MPKRAQKIEQNASGVHMANFSPMLHACVGLNCMGMHIMTVIRQPAKSQEPQAPLYSQEPCMQRQTCQEIRIELFDRCWIRGALSPGHVEPHRSSAEGFHSGSCKQGASSGLMRTFQILRMGRHVFIHFKSMHAYLTVLRERCHAAGPSAGQ